MARPQGRQRVILMYHHVCPAELIPGHSSALEGWQYCLSPQQFRRQLTHVRLRGWKFVSLSSYVTGLRDGTTQRQRLAAVTFDDGWRDNYEFAVPVLVELQVPATIFVVSGAMEGVSDERRMTVPQLRELADYGIAVGAHSRTHPRLTSLNSAALKNEVLGSRCELQDQIGLQVRFFAYPGGRFNQAVVDSVQSAGYEAACSVIGFARNNVDTRFWLYRDVLQNCAGSLRDYLKLSPVVRACLDWRAEKRVRAALATSPHPPG
jgi:peptidoglycan/xylan/chitin deacetylase (PgdA/CDA1 family)